jgi:hypothetical protein
VRESIPEQFRVLTQQLKYSVDALYNASTYLTRSRELGVEMVYEDRNQALDLFLKHLVEYAQRKSENDDKEIIFVGSSLKGLIEIEPVFADRVEYILKKLRGASYCKFLLTHPFYSKYREVQENRPSGGIAKEILHAIAWLEDRGVPSDSIRLYKGTPTCFLIASRERMLINPYPYQKVAYQSFCLEVKETSNGHAIFHSFWTNHFHKPWYGEKKQDDHFMVPNALSYVHAPLEGPLDSEERRVKGIRYPQADFFVLNDTGSFYLAINIRGLETEIPYDRKSDGSCQIVTVDDTLSIRLLNLSVDSKERIWEEIGEVTLNELRNGFWHRMLEGSDCGAYDTYAMLAVYNQDEGKQSPFKFEKAHPLLNNEPLPILWKWLHDESQGDNSQ